MPLVKHVTAGSLAVVIFSLTFLLLLFSLVTLSIGSTSISLGEVSHVILSTFGLVNHDIPETIRTIILSIRFPRIFLAIIVGGSLSIAGVIFQVLLRNSLAEPYILGISGGASVGALLAIATGVSSLFTGGTTVLAFIGALLVITVVYFLGSRRGILESGSLLLSGVMIGAFLSAMILVIIALIGDKARNALFWLLGNLNGPLGTELYIALPLLFTSLVILLVNAGKYNLIALGDDTALSLGVSLRRTRAVSYVAASIITGTVVSMSGAIGFVGLIIPHACRLVFGPDHRILLPSSFLTGSLFLLLADTVSRTILYPIEIPVGAVTAMVGAPLFIVLLKISQ